MKPKTTPMQRLFFALWPDAPVCDQMMAVMAQLPASLGLPVPCANLHITLEFLGGVTAQQRQCAEAVVGQIQGAPFNLVLDQLGTFPRAGVLWLGTSTVPEALVQLTADLRAGLAGCSLSLDPRPYHPHLTLVRKVSRKIELPEQIQPVSWQVEQFVLVESVTHPGGAVYQVLKTWDLK